MKSKLTKNEVSKAQVGPRELKDPRSKEYAIQTLYALKRYSESLRCDQERVAKELAEIDRYEHWKVLGYQTKRSMLKAELNDVGLKNIEKVVKEAPEMPGQGTRTDLEPSDNITKFQRGTQASYLAARLKKDHPEIVERLLAGEFKSIRQAAIAAGIVKPPDPLESAVKAYRKLNHDQRKDFIAIIAEIP